MQKNLYPLKGFEISYSTPDDIPAPYSYMYYIKGQLFADCTVIEYQLTYTGREILSEEEIEEEGFTVNDDFCWQGKLDRIWSLEIAQLFNATSFCKTKAETPCSGLFLVTEDISGKLKKGVPGQPEKWEYLMQEMIQGIYEVSRHEIPLIIHFKKVFPDKNTIRVTLQPYFNTRKVLLTTEKSEGTIKRQELPWPFLKEILRAIYIPDYDPEIAYISEPDEEGTFLDNGEGLWYEFGESVLNPSPKLNVLGQLEEIFLRL